MITVLISRDDLLRILRGSAMGLSTTDGDEVTVRMPTFAEYRAMEASDRAQLAAAGATLPPPAPDAYVRQETTPLS